MVMLQIHKIKIILTDAVIKHDDQIVNSPLVFQYIIKIS